MALWRCRDENDRSVGCGTKYSVGAPRCPHCGETAHIEVGDGDLEDDDEEADMAKASVNGGASNARAGTAPDDEATSPPDPPDQAEPVADPAEPVADPAEPVAEPVVELVHRPRANAATGDWADYVLSLDPLADVGGMGRTDLIRLADEIEEADPDGLE